MKNIDQILLEALDPLLPDCAVPNVYTGDALEYIAWNCELIGQVYAEGKPHAARYLIQIHYYLPHGENPNVMKVRIAQALSEAGCTWPNVTNATDSGGQHWVLECEYTNGGLAYGYA